MHLLESLRQERKPGDWRWERIGWALTALLLVAAMAGAFGTGPLDTRPLSVESAGGTYTVDIPMFNRHSRASDLHVTVHAPEAEGEDLRVVFDATLGTGLRVRSTSPPADGALGADGQSYRYPVDDWSRPLVLSYEYRPDRVGSWEGRLIIQVGGSDPVDLPVRQVIYP